ncbi:MAG: translation initiation factor IF-3 [Patescibacteria group bacterium]
MAKKYFQTNHRITHPELRVLDEFGKQIGVMTREEAVEKAKSEDKDVVLITEEARPPVAKIISFSKFKYQLDQKRAEGKKAAKKQEIKELRFRPFMGDGDFDYRMKKIYEYLEDGDKVRPYVEFKGREITRKEFGFKLIERIVEKTQDLATIEIPAKLLGKKIFLQLMPVKKKLVKVEVKKVDEKPE